MIADNLTEENKLECPAKFALDAISGRWKILIIYHLITGTKRYSELQRLVRDATPKMLTQQLRELEKDGLVQRTIYAQVPPKVEYTLTGKGESIQPIVTALIEWGERLAANELE